MDLKVDKKQESEEKNNNSTSAKSCSDCHTTRTPLWRGVIYCYWDLIFVPPRRQSLGLESERSSKKKKRSSVTRSDEVREILKTRFMALGTDMVLQRSKKLMSKLREEEQAAILLMALSCGSVYA
ncbi:hypothetical protein CDL12_22829 [Handroanthus impetiginosus]|uniref:GATA-type domain-containing protein n=1 Tax=Handroanthus impetiginosus TaxID=429701 RepID=A0A2G9GHZ7_9LAMI|nr:hypothetical protein CDL12_22829 [Handroanthus impetiginosus]